MKALSLHQPYASLIALGLKKIETRHWARPYRGVLLIHAAKLWTLEERTTLDRLRAHYPGLRERWDEAEKARFKPTLGAVVAMARLVDCRVMTEEWIAEQTYLELGVGGWVVGRYGWVLEDVQPVEPPVYLTGRQQLFEVNTTNAGAAYVRLLEQAEGLAVGK